MELTEDQIGDSLWILNCVLKNKKGERNKEGGVHPEVCRGPK